MTAPGSIRRFGYMAAINWFVSRGTDEPGSKIAQAIEEGATSSTR